MKIDIENHEMDYLDRMCKRLLEFSHAKLMNLSNEEIEILESMIKKFEEVHREN